jgi:hypothetical protein
MNIYIDRYVYIYTYVALCNYTYICTLSSSSGTGPRVMVFPFSPVK